MRPYFKLFSRFFLVVTLIIGLFIILLARHVYPIYTDSISFDLKVDQVKKQQFHSLDVLSVGSSMNLYNLDSKTLLQGTNYSYYNFSSWSLSMADIELILKRYASTYHPKYVVICSNILDFRFKADKNYERYFKLADKPLMNWKGSWYYFNYNSVYELIKRKRDVEKTTSGYDHDYYLGFDKWGGISLNVPKKNLPDNFYKANKEYPTAYTEDNFKVLGNICRFLKNQKVKLIFVQTPIASVYMRLPGSPQIISNHISRCKSIVESYGGDYINQLNPGLYHDSLFVDQFHLQSAGAKLLTKQIVNSKPFK